MTDFPSFASLTTTVVPELDRLHVLLPEPLEFGRHRLVAVPESLSVLLSRLRLGDLDPVKKRSVGSSRDVRRISPLSCKEL